MNVESPWNREESGNGENEDIKITEHQRDVLIKLIKDKMEAEVDRYKRKEETLVEIQYEMSIMRLKIAQYDKDLKELMNTMEG